MNYSPKKGEHHGLPYDPFKSSAIPRPIGWLSTQSKDGVDNLAPYSQYQNLTWDPPMVMFAANQSILGGRKDTVRNAEETGWFVWNMATWDLREAVNISAKASTDDVDEFEAAGVAKESCIEAPGARVAGSPVQFECEYVQTIRIPTGNEVSTVDLVIGRVAHVHIADDIILPNGKLDILKIKPIARLGYYDYTVINEIFEMKAPAASAEELAGLEGKNV
ncbi:flavin reductase family protein [Mammaliicoccus sciuri]|uniref:NADH-FMN oxidoreductase RutF, flavin reductase (DIM6/NTAB) family n=2 Tax=Sporosarcina newyorkensis TaxID=759851 RepID=A0A1T4YBZ5_9BACL|nr:MULTISPECIES: flavin reductase family protein [Sporosarcina]EGQ26265.1 nitrilotriacetate monooxygenase component B [Sporosarcina newyorkensis 2681]MBY0223680.1 flavin reductase family protein [Sporosarcina aquimarina]SKA98811.1 NADH-FMN oxidoreductase RutF, flavin reductase (DIM6/NTAB) family [Sporosarcina newyorkensis]